MQHLEVLVDAGLVVVRRQGRQRFNHLNAVPLREVYERWVGEIAGATAEEMLALRRHIERGSPMSEIRTVRVENEIRFKATPERVFAAMTTESLQWFPHTYGEDRVVGIVCEPRAGGLLREDWGDGHGHVYGVFQVWDPPHTYTTRAWLGLGVMLDTETTITADGDGTVLKVSKVAVGPLTEDEAAGIRKYGGLDNFESALRAWIER
jgi:uncharacterized protein YndB with AHSA1/START domain